MKIAKIYLKDNFLFLQPVATSEKNMMFDYYPVEKIPFESTPEHIGHVVINTFDRNATGVLRNNKLSERFAPLFKQMGVKSWKAVTKKSKYMGVMLKDNVYTFWPTHNQGARKGFMTLNDQIIHTDAPLTPEEIGQKVLECLSLSIDSNGLS